MREGIRNKSHLCKGFFSMGGVMESQREDRERIGGGGKSKLLMNERLGGGEY